MRVGEEGIEPSRREPAADFESTVSTIPPLSQKGIYNITFLTPLVKRKLVKRMSIRVHPGCDGCRVDRRRVIGIDCGCCYNCQQYHHKHFIHKLFHHSRPVVSTTQIPSRMSAAAWRPVDPCNCQHKPVVIKCCHASMICSSSSQGMKPSAMPTAS